MIKREIGVTKAINPRLFREVAAEKRARTATLARSFLREMMYSHNATSIDPLFTAHGINPLFTAHGIDHGYGIWNSYVDSLVKHPSDAIICGITESFETHRTERIGPTSITHKKDYSELNDWTRVFLLY